MSQTILLRGARQLLTLRGPSHARRGAALRDLGIIEDGSVLIRDGVIVSVGPTRRLENLKAARDALQVPVDGRIIAPAFIDANLHLSLHRSEDSRQYKRIGMFHQDTLTLMKACLQHGTIAADAGASADGKDFHSDLAVVRKLTKIGSSSVRLVRTWRIGPPCEQKKADDLDSTFRKMLRRDAIDGIAVTAGDDDDFDTDTIREAKLAGLSIKLIWTGHSTHRLVKLLYKLNPHSVYLYNPNSSVIEALGNSTAITVLPAGKQLFEGPVSTVGRDLVDAGAAIALSSGYHSAAPGNFNMQMSMALAVARLGLSPEEAWSAVTVNAAYAVGSGHNSGTLEVGKQADLLILNVNHYRDISQQFGINHVAMVFRDGTMVLNRTRWRPPAEQPTGRVRS